MESSAESLFRLVHENEIATSPELEDICERIEALSVESKTQLVRRLIKTLTKNEMANVLDEIAAKLHNSE